MTNAEFASLARRCPPNFDEPETRYKDDEIDKLEKDVKESYGVIPDIPSLAPEVSAEVTIAVAPYHFVTGFCFVRGCTATVNFAPSV